MIRAGILVTGTEVLSGAVTDRNGPWLSRELYALGVEVAEILIVGDRPSDIREGLSLMEGQGLQLIVASGGLGPTADDLTVETVACHLGLELFTDTALEARIEQIVAPLRQRRGVDEQALRAGNSKQATVPRGAGVLEPVGTAPGLVIPPAHPDGPIVVVLPGPPRELQPMWTTALDVEPLRGLLRSVQQGQVHTMRLFGVPESQLAQTLRQAQRDGVRLAELEVTTCQHRGELEITTRLRDADAPIYADLQRFIASAHPDELFSTDGQTIDEQVAGLLRGSSIAMAESCTGGMLAARLTDLPGSSEYVRGGVVVYSDESKISLAGVPERLITAHGAVSEQVAAALAQGVRAVLDAEVGVGVTGIAGPGGGSPEKPVGLVWLSVAGLGDRVLTRSVRLPGGRPEVRERAVTVAMHMIRRALLQRRS
ncbi:MAG: competence/damage-inducible protein A [Solirubrobacteraceae bacterium]